MKKEYLILPYTVTINEIEVTKYKIQYFENSVMILEEFYSNFDGTNKTEIREGYTKREDSL